MQYFYALVSVAVAGETTTNPDVVGAFTTEAPVVCYGPRCFRSSLWVATGCAIVSAAGFLFVSRRWKA